jgi:hypothetical protein
MVAPGRFPNLSLTFPEPAGDLTARPRLHGRGEDELRRLAFNAELLAPITRQMLAHAGASASFVVAGSEVTASPRRA